MTDDLVKAAREALVGVTEGPWWTDQVKFSIAAARSLVPKMADRIVALEAEVARLHEILADQDMGIRMEKKLSARDLKPVLEAHPGELYER